MVGTLRFAHPTVLHFGGYLSLSTSPNNAHDLPSNRAIWIWRIGVTLSGSVYTLMPGSSIGSSSGFRLVACLMMLSRL